MSDGKVKPTPSNASTTLGRDLINAAQQEHEEACRRHALVDADGHPLEPAVLPDIPGYRVEHEIGHGGMGRVFKAVQLATGRGVAIKMPHPHLYTASGQARFDREIEVLAALNHPHIVTIIDGGRSAADQPFFAMDYVPGARALDEWARSDDTDRKQALALFATVCDAVGAAHRQGVVHRDLKPGNILIGADGHPRILDFGLAWNPQAVSAPEPLTTSGTGMSGTLGYCSPEQAAGAGDRIDVRSDVYALGVILYQLLTGRFPYDVSGPDFQIREHILCADIEPPSRWSADVTPALDVITLQALSRPLGARQASAAQLGREIRACLEAGAGSTSRLIAPAKASGAWWRVAVLLVAVSVALALWSRSSEQRSPQAPRKVSTPSSQSPSATQSTSPPNAVGAAPGPIEAPSPMSSRRDREDACYEAMEQHACETLIAEDPQDLRARAALVRGLLPDDAAAARSALQDAMRVQSNDAASQGPMATLWFLRSVLEWQDNRHEDALHALQMAADLSPLDPCIQTWLARGYLHRHQRQLRDQLGPQHDVREAIAKTSKHVQTHVGDYLQKMRFAERRKQAWVHVRPLTVPGDWLSPQERNALQEDLQQALARDGRLVSIRWVERWPERATPQDCYTLGVDVISARAEDVEQLALQMSLERAGPGPQPKNNNVALPLERPNLLAALAAASKAVEDPSAPSQAWRMLGQAQIASGLLDQGLRSAIQAASHGDLIFGHGLAAHAAKRLGRDDAADHAAKRALVSQHEEHMTWLTGAACLWIDSRQDGLLFDSREDGGG